MTPLLRPVCCNPQQVPPGYADVLTLPSPAFQARSVRLPPKTFLVHPAGFAGWFLSAGDGVVHNASAGKLVRVFDRVPV